MQKPLLKAKNKPAHRRNHTISNTSYMRLEEPDDTANIESTVQVSDFRMPKPQRVRNSQEWNTNTVQYRNKNNNVKKSVHLKIGMQRTHNSIIPEEYEPYSTGRISMAKGSTIQTSTSFNKIKKEIAKEYNMYQKVEQQR